MDAEADLAHLRRVPCGEQRRDVASLLFRAVAEERTGESAMCTYCWRGSAEQEEDRDLLDVRERIVCRNSTAADARKPRNGALLFSNGVSASRDGDGATLGCMLQDSVQNGAALAGADV